MNDQIMNTLAAQMVANNPKLKPLWEMMQAQQEQQQKPIAKQLQSYSHLKRKHQELSRKIKILQQDYQQTEALLDELAEALGACQYCWGTHHICEHCAGEGKPGYFKINQELFDHYIKPTIQQLVPNEKTTTVD